MVSLDLFRAMAIVLVVFNHSSILFNSHTGEYLSVFKLPFIYSGWVGVQLFFVLSGYLIGFQLWKELKETNSINIKTFMIKRTFRIWPLFYFVAILFLLTRGSLSGKGLYPDLYFLSNYLNEEIIKGSWSLSVEEQFYLLTPLLLIFGRKVLSWELALFRKALLAIFLLAPLVRYLTLATSLGGLNPSADKLIHYLYMPIHTNYDSLIIGLFLSNCRVEQKFDTKKLTKMLFLAAVVFFGLRLLQKNIFNYSFLAVIFGCFVWVGLEYEATFGKYFNFSIVRMLAKLSFGIYLLHYQVGKWLYPSILKITAGMPLTGQYLLAVMVLWIVTIFLAGILFVLIEKPALNYRNKFL